MATCAFQPLLDTSNCYTGYPPFELLVMEVQMLCNLLDKIQNSGEVTCDPDELLDQGKCFAALPAYILQTLKLSLLCEISNAI